MEVTHEAGYNPSATLSGMVGQLYEQCPKQKDM